jgi:hypothetical protein
MPITLNGNGPIAGATTVNGLTLPTDSLQPGMVLVNKTDFSTVSSVSVNNCFTSSYDSYRVVVRVSAASGTDAYLRVRLRANGTDNSTASSYYQTSLYSGGSSASGNSGTGDTFGLGVATSAYAPSGGYSYDFFSPAIAAPTVINGHSFYTMSAGARYLELADVYHNVSSAFDGFTFYPSTGNVTGSIRVYGMRNA